MYNNAIYEIYEYYSGHTVKYFHNRDELEHFLEHFRTDSERWEVRMHYTQPDMHYPSKAEIIKENRDNLIDGLLND